MNCKATDASTAYTQTALTRSRCGMGGGNSALKIGGSRLRAISVPCVGSSITGQESAAFVTAPAAAQKWKVVQTDDAVQR